MDKVIGEVDTMPVTKENEKWCLEYCNREPDLSQVGITFGI